MMNYNSIVCFIEEINKYFLNNIRNIFTITNHSYCNTVHGLVVFSIYIFECVQSILLLLRRITILFCDKISNKFLLNTFILFINKMKSMFEGRNCHGMIKLSKWRSPGGQKSMCFAAQGWLQGRAAKLLLRASEVPV